MTQERPRPLRYDAVGVTGAMPATDDTPVADATGDGSVGAAMRAAPPEDDAWINGLGRLARLTALIVMVALIELLPVQAWLMTLAAYQTGDARLTAAPFWLVALTLAVFGVGGRLTAQSSGAIRVGAGIVIGAVVFTGALLWPSGAFAISDPANKPLAFIGLAALVAYLGWRGVSAGATIPFAVAFDRFRRIFTFGLAAMVGAITISIAAPDSARAPLIGALGLFLPIEVFAGLLALAISKAAFQRANAFGAETALPDETRWLGMAVGLATLVIVVALVISVIVSFQTVSSALLQLGPVGVFLNTALTWAINVFAYILYLIFNIPITDLKNQHFPFTPPRKLHQACVQRTSRTTPHLARGQVYCPPNHSPISPLFIDALVGVLSAIIAVVIVIAVIFLVREMARLLSQRRRGKAANDADEEREDLDARNLLGAQLRELLGARRPRPRAEEPLPQGSVRWLYREALRAAAGRGVTRAADETPDEFAARLAPIIGALAPATRNARTPATGGAAQGESQADFAELSDAYNRARYDDAEPAGAQHATLREHATRLIRRLRGDGRRR